MGGHTFHIKQERVTTMNTHTSMNFTLKSCSSLCWITRVIISIRNKILSSKNSRLTAH